MDKEIVVHIGTPHWVNWFERPVTTLFFFVSVEVFIHTHNKVLYLLRLYIGMEIMSFGSLLIQKVISYDEVEIANNIFSELCVGAFISLSGNNLFACTGSLTSFLPAIVIA